MKFLSTLFVLNIICQCFCSPSNEVGEKKKKTILALGGNGFIGSAVLHNLLSKGTYDPVITRLFYCVVQTISLGHRPNHLSLNNGTLYLSDVLNSFTIRQPPTFTRSRSFPSVRSPLSNSKRRTTI